MINNFNQFKNLVEMNVLLFHQYYIIKNINVTSRVMILTYFNTYQF